MSSGLNARIATIVLVFLVCLLIISPNFISFSKDHFLSKSKLRYGLDIQGGIHLVMGVDVNEALRQNLLRTGEGLVRHAKTEALSATDIKLKTGSTNEMVLTYTKAEEKGAITDFITKYYSNLFITDSEGQTISLQSSDVYTEQTKKEVVDQAIETIRNRIDEFGVSEPSITAQGSDRILMQLPGIDDAARAKELINKTARLEFMLVDNTEVNLPALIQDAEKAGNYKLGQNGLKYSEYIRRLNADLASKLPPKTHILFGKQENVESLEMGRIPYLLRSDTGLGGDSLRNARISTGEFNEPEVNLTFNPEGAQKFADLTGNNIGRQLAIVLDDMVYSAPSLQGRIPDGNARITLGGGRDYNQMFEEAKTISMALRAGALPARLEQLEERTVGPSLGADSISAGLKASYIGAALIFIFMIFYYRTFGLLACFGLCVNILMLLTGLTMIDATLTLPGIAGIALTLGIAVDANVIINERIKEELARGANFQAAVREGYEKAFSAIMDSNITTIATCLVLIYFGSGPVRGFGVTLTVGLITSMFTAIFFTRTIVDTLLYKFKVNKISI